MAAHAATVGTLDECITGPARLYEAASIRRIGCDSGAFVLFVAELLRAYEELARQAAKLVSTPAIEYEFDGCNEQSATYDCGCVLHGVIRVMLTMLPSGAMGLSLALRIAFNGQPLSHGEAFAALIYVSGRLRAPGVIRKAAVLAGPDGCLSKEVPTIYFTVPLSA